VQSSPHLLSAILFTPAIGALVLFFVPRESFRLHRMIGNLFGLLGFLLSVRLFFRFPAGYASYAYLESYSWIPSFGARYALGVDGISLVLVALTTFLGVLALLSSWSAIQIRSKECYIVLLLLQTAMLGAFMARDLFLFYVFWEVSLVTAYFLIGTWGTDRRLYAALKFFLYTFAGSLLMLLAILALYFSSSKLTGIQTFDIPTLLATAQQLPDSLKTWIFWGFFFAFAVMAAMFPFHTWLPDANTDAPTAGSILLSGVLLKMGSYGFLRFSVPLLPADLQFRAKMVHVLIALSLIAIVYGAVLCLMQKDMKRLIGYGSVVSMGFCTLGIFTLTPSGLSGSVLHQVNHGVSSGALFLIVGVLYDRRRTRLISELGGLAGPMPNLAVFYLIASLSAFGLPLLNGFISEFAILQGAFSVNKVWAAWAVLGIILSAASLLWLYQRAMFGPITHEINKTLPDLDLREYATLLPLLAVILWIGIYPRPFFDLINAPVEKAVRQVNPAFYEREASPLSDFSGPQHKNE
jgi:NADH-quinone oxidoreductase subunit M